MLQRTKIIVIACLLSFGLAAAAHAEFTLVSGFQTQNPAVDSVGPGGDPNNVARSLVHGYPLWYQDTATALKIAPCLDFGPIIDKPANLTVQAESLTFDAVNAFCFGEAATLNPALPVSFNGGAFPENMPEIFGYYILGAEAGGDFNGNGLEDGLILVESGLHGGFLAEIPNDNEQIMFADTFVRLRGLPPAAGYTLQTAYVDFTFEVLGPDVRFTQSAPATEPPVPGDFLGVLAVAPAAEPVRDVATLVTSGVVGPPAVFDDIDEFFAWNAAEIVAYDTAFQASFPNAAANGGVPATPGVDVALNRIFSPVLNTAGLPSGAEQLYVAVGQAEPAIEPAPPGFQAPAEQPVFDVGAAPQIITLTAPVPIEPDVIINATGAAGSDGLGDIDGNANLNDIVITTFSLQGKIFNEGTNAAPVGVADIGFAAASISSIVATPGGASLDVAFNDTDDPVGGTNEHPIHPGSPLAMAWNEARLGTPILSYTELPSDPTTGNLLLASSVATEMGGTVRRAADRNTGRMQFMYTPPPEVAPGQPFVGPDRFMYVVQDTGGLISTVTQATINVEAVAMTVQYRAKTGRWTVSGNTSTTVGSAVEIFSGASIGPGAAPVGTATVGADGSWKFEGKLPVSPDGSMSCRTANGVALLNIPVDIR